MMEDVLIHNWATVRVVTRGQIRVRAQVRLPGQEGILGHVFFLHDGWLLLLMLQT